MGQQAQRDVAVPGAPLPELVMVHPDLSFCFFEGTLYDPALPADPEQFLHRGILRALGLVEGYLFGIV